MLNSLTIVGKVPPDNQEWAGRREWIFHDTSWHFESFADLEAARLRDDSSMGLIWAIETVQNPEYPLELLRLIARSVEALRFVGQLPKLDVIER